MSVSKEEDLRQRLKLYESVLPSAIVRWNEADSILINEIHGSSVLSKGKYELHSLIDSKELQQVRQYWQSIGESTSETAFSIFVEEGKYDVHCSALRSNGDVISNWTFVAEKDRSISYLQNAAHDFRAPLGSIIGVVNLLQHSLSSNDEFDKEEMITLLDMIKVNSDKGLRLAEEIMELAEIESNDYQLKTNKVVMHDFVQNYLATHRLLTLRKKISVRFESASASSLLINESKLTRALDNILSNSVKFSKEGSEITFQLSEDVDKVVLSITDQGIGMSPQVLKNLFVKFGKAKRNGLEGEPSHGLGMSIVRQILKLHGGSIEVTSEENKGTQVRLKLNKAE